MTWRASDANASCPRLAPTSHNDANAVESLSSFTLSSECMGSF